MIATLALLASLNTVPSAAALAEAGALRGVLVRVDVTVDDATAPQIPLEQMTRQQLRAEYRRLDANKPSIAGQITAVALGGVTIAAGAVTLWFTFVLTLGGVFRTVPLTAALIGAILA